MANMPPNDRVMAEKAARIPKCVRCRNHGLVVPLKGHSGRCQFKPCVCWKCSLINERTKILASHRRIKTSNGNESPSANRPEQSTRSDGKTVSVAYATKTGGINGETETSAGPKSDITARVHQADSNGKTYTELHAPVTGASAGYCELKAATGLNAHGDPPPFPGEYIITEAIPRHVFPGEMFAVPVPLYPHYPDRYMYPAVLLTLRPPAPGPPPGAPSCPLETQESQFHMPGYSPYPTYPVLRDEHGPRPLNHLLSHMDGEQEISKVHNEQAEHTSESHVCSNQEQDVVPADGLSKNKP